MLQKRPRMPKPRRNKKLRVGDQVVAFFLGSPEQCEVIAITEPGYKLMTRKGIILPNANWFDPNEKKKSPWYIDSMCTERISMDTPKNPEVSRPKRVTKKRNTKLEQAIQKQKDFIRGKHKK